MVSPGASSILDTQFNWLNHHVLEKGSSQAHG